MRTAILDLLLLFIALLLANVLTHFLVMNIPVNLWRIRKRRSRLMVPEIESIEDYVPPSKEQREQEENEQVNQIAAVMVKAFKKMKEDPEV